MKIGRGLRDIVIISGITVILLILSEAGLRIVFPEKVNKSRKNYGQEVACVFNKDYLISLKSSVRKEYLRSNVNGGGVIKWETNSHSFRGKELQGNPDIRIIVYGDSNILARFSILEDTFPYKLEEYLNKEFSGLKVEVLNSGIMGLGPDQSLIKLSQDIDKYKPNIVILHLFADNDFGDIIRNRIFTLDANDNLVPTNFKQEKDEILIDAEDKRHKKVNEMLSSLLIVSVLKKAAGVFSVKSLTEG